MVRFGADGRSVSLNISLKSRENGESPATARRHVRVIEDQAGTTDQELAVPATAGEPLMKAHPGGFHVRAVPIDQPFDEGATRISMAHPE